LAWAGVLVLLVGLATSTTITFYVDHEVEQPLDYVEISAIVKTSGDSLEDTIDEAAAIIASVETAVKEYCRSYAKEKGECEGIVETDPYSIKPQYELLKKKPLFAGPSLSTQASSSPTKCSSASRKRPSSANWSTTSSNAESTASTLWSGSP
jgi:hypothetical protein